jgi:hypothetical protein
MARADLINLDGSTPIAQGTYRDVYLVPGQEDVLVKVLRPGSTIREGRPIRNFLKRRSTRFQYGFMYRETHCYMDLKLRQSKLGGPLPITELYGLTQTSKGLGMVAERVRGADGNHAQSLRRLKDRDGFGDDHLVMLNHFIAEAFRWDLRANDTNPDNLLLDAFSPDHRFILVDGFGDANAIPINHWFTSQNRKKLHRRFEKMAAFLGLTWDAETLCIRR